MDERDVIETDLDAAVAMIMADTGPVPDTVVVGRDAWIDACSILDVHRPPRDKRRRSRQCRGRRGRNYIRATMREFGSDGFESISLLNEAIATGALASLNRNRKRVR